MVLLYYCTVVLSETPPQLRLSVCLLNRWQEVGIQLVLHALMLLQA